MYHNHVTQPPSTCASEAEAQRVKAWQRDVAESQAQVISTQARQVSQAEQNSPRVVINQTVNTPVVVVTRVSPESKPTEEISTKAIIGTILGASAGAAVAYAMTKSESDSNRGPRTKKITTYRTIYAPGTQSPQAQNITPRPNDASNGSHHQHTLEDYNRPGSWKSMGNQSIDSYPKVLMGQGNGSRASGATSLHRTHDDNAITPSHISRHSSTHVSGGHVTAHSNGTKVGAGTLNTSQSSHTPSGREALERTNPPTSATITEVRIARDVPLPHSQTDRVAVEEGTAGKEEDVKTVLASLTPDDSISQVSSRRSSGSEKPKGFYGSKSGRVKRSDHMTNRPAADAGGKSGSRREHTQSRRGHL